MNAGRDGEGRLALDEPEIQRPWLDAVDDDDDYGDEGLDWSRITRFLGMLAIIAVVIAIVASVIVWRMSAPPEGDGSLIEAAEEPYKVRPKNPGGMKFEGTGDTAYMIGEGVEQRGRLGGANNAPPVPAPAAGGESPDAPVMTGVAVQIGAFSTEEDARTGWQKLTARYEPLGGYDRRIVEGRADIGVVYRLQAITASRAAAFALCRDLRSNGIECQVKL
jgi:hypothetical protein